MANQKVFFVANEKVAVNLNDSVSIKDLGDVYCNNNKWKKDIEKIEVYRSGDMETWDVIGTTDIMKAVLKQYPDTELEYFGKEDIILEIKSKEKAHPIVEFLKVGFVTVVLFFGAALGIMYFHEDVNMVEALEKLYFTFTGENKKNPLIMNIPYSIGLGVGMIVFFSRVISPSKRRRMEPGPMDVELHSFNKDRDNYILYDLENKKKKE